MRSLFFASAVLSLTTAQQINLCGGLNTTAIMGELMGQLANMTAMTEGFFAGRGAQEFAPTDAGGFFNITDFSDFFTQGLQNMTQAMNQFTNCIQAPTDENVGDFLTTMMAQSTRYDIALNATEADGFVERITNKLNRLETRAQDLSDSLSLIQESLRQVGALTLRHNASAVYSHRNNNFTFYSRVFDPKESLDTGKTRVKFPALNHGNKTVSLIEWANNPYKSKAARKLLSKVISLQLADLFTGNETQVWGLTEEINITHYIQDPDPSGQLPSCAYWNTTLGAWRTDGCAMRRAWGNWVLCGCTHLTDFAVVSPSASSESGKADLGAIIGGAVGGGLGLIVIAALVAGRFFILNQRRRNNQNLVKSYTNPAVQTHGTQV